MTGTHTGSRSGGLDTRRAGDDSSLASKTKTAVGSATGSVKDAGTELQHKAGDQVSEVAHKVTDKADAHPAQHDAPRTATQARPPSASKKPSMSDACRARQPRG